MWPTMTFEVKLHIMLNFRLHDVSIHRISYHNRIIKEFAKKSLVKILETQSFFVRFRRTYLLNKTNTSIDWSGNEIKSEYYSSSRTLRKTWSLWGFWRNKKSNERQSRRTRTAVESAGCTQFIARFFAHCRNICIYGHDRKWGQVRG